MTCTSTEGSKALQNFGLYLNLLQWFYDLPTHLSKVDALNFSTKLLLPVLGVGPRGFERCCFFPYLLRTHTLKPNQQFTLYNFGLDAFEGSTFTNIFSTELSHLIILITNEINLIKFYLQISIRFPFFHLNAVTFDEETRRETWWVNY